MIQWKTIIIGMALMLFQTSLVYSREGISYRSELKHAIEAVEKGAILCEYPSNGWGSVPEMWKLQQKLDSLATPGELCKLADDHLNGALIICVAFKLLIPRDPGMAKEIMFSSLSDDRYLSISYCDVHDGISVADYMISKTTRTQDAQRPIFTRRDSMKLDSMIIFTPKANETFYFRELMDRLEPRAEYYERLHVIFADKNTKALQGIARYRCDDDKPLIISSLMKYNDGLAKDGSRDKSPDYEYTNSALQAVVEWPDNAFLAPIAKLINMELKRKYFDYYRIKLIYEALMSYDNNNSYNMIDNVLSVAEGSVLKYHKSILKEAYDDKPRERYKPLIEKYCQDVD